MCTFRSYRTLRGYLYATLKNESLKGLIISGILFTKIGTTIHKSPLFGDNYAMYCKNWVSFKSLY